MPRESGVAVLRWRFASKLLIFRNFALGVNFSAKVQSSQGLMAGDMTLNAN